MEQLALVLQGLAGIVVLAPLLLLVLLCMTSLIEWKLGEKTTAWACLIAILFGLGAAWGIVLIMLGLDQRQLVLIVGDWVAMGSYHFTIQLVFDLLSVPMVILTFLLCGIIVAFTNRYLHRESGYHRFFVFFALFLAGMVVAALAGTIEMLLVGWEMVGLSSVMLVAFFQERPQPIRNALRLWVVYLVADAALLLAVVVMHHQGETGTGHLLWGEFSWPQKPAVLLPVWSWWVGLLLVIAAAGKSALLPFSGWLPRAMEGPTPSSAIFYGALSVHLGVFLLLRLGHLWESIPSLAYLLAVLGLGTALFAYLAGSVQTDIKSVLAFASLIQVGLIVAEIGVGWRYIPLAHLVGNACLRTFQFIRAPSLLHDRRRMESALGGHLPRPSEPFPLARAELRLWLFRWLLERGYWDSWLHSCIVSPFVRLMRRCERWEQKWYRWLAGTTAAAFPLDSTSESTLEDVI